jgi:hypothetical protein
MVGSYPILNNTFPGLPGRAASATASLT